MTISGPNNTTGGNQYTYTATGFNCSCISALWNITLPTGWILLTSSLVLDVLTFTVIAGSDAGNITVQFGCKALDDSDPCYSSTSFPVTPIIQPPANIGVCCSSYGQAVLDTTGWANNVGVGVTLTIFFGNQADATTALGAYEFISSSNISLTDCLLDLVSQINAAAADNPSGNPEGLSPASLIGTQLTITSWPTPSDETPCGVTTNFDYGFKIVCSIPADVTMPNTSADFINGGMLINCFGVPSITGSSFVCTGQQATLTLTFPGGVPPGYTVIPPTGWTLVGSSVSGLDTIAVTLIPGSSVTGTLSISYSSGRVLYTNTFLLVNDCFIGQCVSNMLLSQFCNDQDICCSECDDYKKKDKEIATGMFNKTIGLMTTYSLAKQTYFLTCNTADLNNVVTILNQIKEILIRCSICPSI